MVWILIICGVISVLILSALILGGNVKIMKNAISDVSLLEWEQILEVMDFKKWEVAYLIKSNGKLELLGAPYFGETVIMITKDEVKQHIRNFQSKESNRV